MYLSDCSQLSQPMKQCNIFEMNGPYTCPLIRYCCALRLYFVYISPIIGATQPHPIQLINHTNRIKDKRTRIICVACYS